MNAAAAATSPRAGFKGIALAVLLAFAGSATASDRETGAQAATVKPAANATQAVVDENGRIVLKASGPAKPRRKKSPYVEDEEDDDTIVVGAPGDRDRFPGRMRFMNHPLECRIF
jgi:hypothetical protein